MFADNPDILTGSLSLRNPKECESQAVQGTVQVALYYDESPDEGFPTEWLVEPSVIESEEESGEESEEESETRTIRDLTNIVITSISSTGTGIPNGSILAQGFGLASILNYAIQGFWGTGMATASFEYFSLESESNIEASTGHFVYDSPLAQEADDGTLPSPSGFTNADFDCTSLFGDSDSDGDGDGDGEKAEDKTSESPHSDLITYQAIQGEEQVIVIQLNQHGELVTISFEDLKITITPQNTTEEEKAVDRPTFHPEGATPLLFVNDAGSGNKI